MVKNIKNIIKITLMLLIYVHLTTQVSNAQMLPTNPPAQPDYSQFMLKNQFEDQKQKQNSSSSQQSALNTCGGPLECSKAKSCKPEVDPRNISVTGGKLLKTNSSNKIDSSCLRNQVKESCFDSVPTSFSGSYNSIGYRGSGDNRNHYGTDIGMAGTTNAYAYAAADGEIVLTRTNSTGSGLTMVINHKKGCKGAGDGDDGYYHTTYRHLFKFIKTSGAVKKGDKIGIVGGSNFPKSLQRLCQHPTQQDTKCGYGGTTGKGYYAIHLHFEVAEGKFSGSSTQAYSSTILEPYCEDIQTLCGGCPNNADSCKTGVVNASGDGQYAGINEGISNAASMSYDANGNPIYTDNCELGSYLDKDNCTFCALFKTIFNAASTIAKKANDSLAAPTVTIVGVGFIIWLAIFVLKNITAFGGASPGEMIKGILFQGFRVAVVILILKGALYEIMDVTLNPVMQTGLTFSQEITTGTCQDSEPYMQGIIGYDSTKGFQENSTGGLSQQIGGGIICSIKRLEDSVGYLMSLGNYSMCLATDRYDIWDFFPHLGYLTTGIFLWIVGLALLLAFPWCLVDCVLQLCVAAALLPCAIGAFAFKVTAKYLKNIWNFFMNAMFNFVFLSLIVYIINSNFKSWIGVQDDGSVQDVIFISGLNSQGLAWWGVGAIKVAAICFFCWTFFDEAKSMSDKFAKGVPFAGGKGIGRMVGGTMAAIGQNAGKAVGNVAQKTAGAVGGFIGESINSAYGNSIRSGMNKIKGQASNIAARGISKLPGSKRFFDVKTESVKDEKGNVVGYKTSYHAFGRQHTRTTTQDADGLWTQEKESYKRSATDKGFESTINENGEREYTAKKRIFGITYGKEKMTSTVDSEGKTIYTTADGKRKLIIGQDGKLESYKDAYSRGYKTAYQHSRIRTKNDAFGKVHETTDGKGNVTSRRTELNNVTAKYLINKDGTTNTQAFGEIMRGSENKKAAAEAIVQAHMESRGQQLSNNFQSRETTINEDGSVNIVQQNVDGSTQIIHAVMDGDQLIINNQIMDTKGNITSHKSNGIQSQVQYFNKREDGTYYVRTKTSFSAYIHSQNKHMKPLDSNGKWGNNIDANKAMKGFTQQDYDNHITQLVQKDAGHDATIHNIGVTLNEVKAQLNINGQEKENIIDKVNAKNTGHTQSEQDKTIIFPPETYKTGNDRIDMILTKEDEDVKYGYDTGNKETDQKLNDTYRSVLEENNKRAEELGVSSKDYRINEAIIRDFRDNIEEGKELQKIKFEAIKETTELNKKYNIGTKTLSGEELKKYEQEFKASLEKQRIAQENYLTAEDKYIKANFSDEVYQNYRKIREQREKNNNV